MLLFIKFILGFLLLQELARRTGIRGLKVHIRPFHTALNAPLCLGLLITVILSPDFAGDWLLMGSAVVIVSLLLTCFFHTPAYSIPPARHKCKNGIEYFTFFPATRGKSTTRFFFHGGGNDALFDNFELFNRWIQQGDHVIAVNLPGHGKGGSTVLNPAASFSQFQEAYIEITSTHKNRLGPVHLTGESLGGVFALDLCHHFENIESLDLLATPTRVKPSSKGVILEFLHFFSYQQWWRLGHDTLWEAIPSFSVVKRSYYPIRTLKDEKPVSVYHRLAGDFNEREPASSFKNSKLAIRIFHGLFDGIIPFSQSVERFNQLKQLGFNVQLLITRSFHLSIKKWYMKYL